uniref:Uncharacterized protein n=1 Tax=Meloidogyne floridensis TaxID=298350 RepID=A0A915P089_9BILA
LFEYDDASVVNQNQTNNFKNKISQSNKQTNETLNSNQNNSKKISDKNNKNKQLLNQKESESDEDDWPMYICFDQPNKTQKIMNQNINLNNDLNRQTGSSNLVLGLGGKTFERDPPPQNNKETQVIKEQIVNFNNNSLNDNKNPLTTVEGIQQWVNNLNKQMEYYGSGYSKNNESLKTQQNKDTKNSRKRNNSGSERKGKGKQVCNETIIIDEENNNSKIIEKKDNSKINNDNIIRNLENNLFDEIELDQIDWDIFENDPECQIKLQQIHDQLNNSINDVGQSSNNNAGGNYFGNENQNIFENNEINYNENLQLINTHQDLQLNQQIQQNNNKQLNHGDSHFDKNYNINNIYTKENVINNNENGLNQSSYNGKKVYSIILI